MYPLISIIVPIYNAELYLHRCIDSLLLQTFQQFEILLINDGSSDKSGEICDKYSLKDKRIRIFHKKNEGVSLTRQYGIDNALGKYTIHVDPDDWVEENMLEELYKKAIEENADMVICDYYKYINGEAYLNKLKIDSLNPKALLHKFLQQDLHGATWNKLIRTSCYIKYNIKFPENIIRWEDLYVICNFMLHPIKVSYLPKAFYYYDLTINTNSIVRKPTMQGLLSQIYFVDYFNKILDNKIYSQGLYKIKATTKELAFASGLLTNKEIKALYSEINKKYILEYKFNGIHISLAVFLSGFPKTGKFLLNLYRKFKH